QGSIPYAEGHWGHFPVKHNEGGGGCAQSMVRAEAYNVRARAVWFDERDHAIVLSLLEHKVLTTHQIKVLYFRSLRRCQHRFEKAEGSWVHRIVHSGKGLRGLQSERWALPPHLAPRALGQEQSGGRQARRVRALPASRRSMRVLPRVRPGNRGVRG